MWIWTRPFHTHNNFDKVKVTGVKICVRMERPCPYTHAYQIWRLYLKGHRSYEHFSKPKRRFLNLNADPYFKDKVTGVKIFVRMERPCPYTHAYQIWRLYLKGHRSYEHFSKPKRRFWNLNADPYFKVKVTGVKIVVRMERPCPYSHAYQIWRLYLKGHKSYEHFSKPKCRFWNLNADPYFKVKFTGVKICVRMERPCPYTHAYQIWRLYVKGHRSYEHFSKPKRRFWNLNADPFFKMKVTGVKIFVRVERPCPYSHAYQIWRLYLKRHRSYEHFSKPKRRFWNINADPYFKVKVTGVKIFVRLERPCPYTHAYQIWRLYVKGHRSYEHFSNRTPTLTLTPTPRWWQ